MVSGEKSPHWQIRRFLQVGRMLEHVLYVWINNQEGISKMKITIIGSTGLKDKMHKHADKLRAAGHEVELPFFDDSTRRVLTTTTLDSLPARVNMTELQLSQGNLAKIKWADRVDIIWDRRSVGAVFDFGMVIALSKPIELVYLEPKTLTGVMRQYKEDMDKREV